MIAANINLLRCLPMMLLWRKLDYSVKITCVDGATFTDADELSTVENTEFILHFRPNHLGLDCNPHICMGKVIQMRCKVPTYNSAKNYISRFHHNKHRKIKLDKVKADVQDRFIANSQYFRGSILLYFIGLFTFMCEKTVNLVKKRRISESSIKIECKTFRVGQGIQASTTSIWIIIVLENR